MRSCSWPRQKAPPLATDLEATESARAPQVPPQTGAAQLEAPVSASGEIIVSMPKRTHSAHVASLAVARVQLAVAEGLRWLFREQPTEDYGIDAHVEVVEDDQVQGRLLALQIKGGLSWFSEPHADGWWYRPSAAHVSYWLNHSLPVAVVLNDEATDVCYWALINRQTLVQAGAGWKVLVPRDQVLNASAREGLLEATEGDPYELRLRELRLAKPWMEMLSAGTRLVIEFEEWVNKSSGRGSISIGVDHEDGKDPETLAAWHLFIGPSSYADTVPRLFAWADVELHEETYDAADQEAFEEECSIWDEGEQLFRTTFADWQAGRALPAIRPYENGAGEVDFYRLELALNELGRSFLVVDQFATDGLRQFTAT